MGVIEPSNVPRLSPLRVGFAILFSHNGGNRDTHEGDTPRTVRDPRGAAAKEEEKPMTLTTTTIAYDGEHPHRIVWDVDWMKQNPFR